MSADHAVDHAADHAADPALARVRRLDAAQLVALVNEHTDAGLVLLGPAPGGQVGAAYVRWPDGHEGVLTVGPDGAAERFRVTADLLTLARSRGLPVPAYELVAAVPGAVAVVQERLPGRMPSRAERGVVEAMVAINAEFAGVLEVRTDLDPADLYLRRSGPGFSIHESLAIHSDRSRRLLDWVREVGTADSARMVGTDLVHFDFRPANVLVDDAGAISGIIDWDGIARGDRRLDLVTLRWGVATERGDASTAAWLDDLLDQTIEPDVLRTYWATMSLREVDWAIRHHTRADVDRMLDLAETRMDR